MCFSPPPLDTSTHKYIHNTAKINEHNIAAVNINDNFPAAQGRAVNGANERRMKGLNFKYLAAAEQECSTHNRARHKGKRKLFRVVHKSEKLILMLKRRSPHNQHYVSGGLRFQFRTRERFLLDSCT